MASVKKRAPSPKGQTEQRLRMVRRTSILMKQVGDATRLRIILMLSEGERHVGAMGEVLNQNQPAVSYHLALLRNGGIINVRRQGKSNFYGLSEMGEDLVKIVKGVVA